MTSQPPQIVSNFEPEGTILVVDADGHGRQLARHILGDNYRVLEAESLAQARELLSRIWFDCVVVDVQLPDGACLELLQDVGAASMTAIVLASESDEAMAAEALDRGALDFLVRDRFRPDVLRRTVLHAIERGQLRRTVQEQAARLQAREDLLFEVLGTLPVGVCVLDADGAVRYLNEGAQQILGTPRGEGRSIYETIRPARLFMRDTRNAYPLAQLPLIKALTGQPSTVEDIEVDDGKGIRRQIQMSGTPLHDEDGQVRHAVATLQDITEGQRLARRVRVAQRMESVGQLAGGIAHDFNNLLTIIYGYASLAHQRTSRGDPNRTDLEHVISTTQRAEKLTKKLLAFSRLQVVRPVVLDVNDVITDVNSMLDRAVGENVQIRLELQHGAWRCVIDVSALEQVIVNLAVNARDAMSDGGVLRIRTDGVVVDDAYRAEVGVDVPSGEYTRISVSDTGCGIPPEDRDRIFEPFYTTKVAGKGTGLGLSTCYGLVKQAGGFIWVRSEIGKGTTFELIFPRVHAEVQAVARRRTQLNLRGTETILLVEDAQMVRNLAERILKRLGYRVLAAPGGDEALKLAAEFSEPIDLLLTDVIMVGMNGCDLTDKFQAARPNTPVLYMSGYPIHVVQRHGVEGDFQLLEKPFTPDSLGLKVRSILDEQPPSPTDRSTPRDPVCDDDDE